MPKLKTRKCAAKRLKETGTGKFRHHKAGARHLKTFPAFPGGNCISDS